MKNQLVNTKRISISNFTFDSKTNTISFFSTKTNKCWSCKFKPYFFELVVWLSKKPRYCTEENLNSLKKLCKNGNN